MILQGLWAQNVLRYARLVLSDIPERGLIAISGRNESGKTAIVETICFALFGRTFSIPEQRLEQVIRWNEPGCQVELRFWGRDDVCYRIERSLDYKGAHAALLFRHDEAEPFVSGPQEVSRTVCEVCGFDFPQYLDALYLAQREISTPHSQSETIKAIAGGAELEAVLNELPGDIADEQDRIRELDGRVDERLRQIDALDLSAQSPQDIEQEQQVLKERIREAEQAVRALDTAADDIQAGCPRVQAAGKAVATASLDTSLRGWANMIDALESRISSLRHSCQGIETDSELCAEHGRLNRYVADFGERLDAFEAVQDRMEAYRVRLAALLGEDGGQASSTERPLPVQQRDTGRQMRRLFVQNAVCLGGVLVFAVATLVCLFVWFQSGSVVDPVTTERLLGFLEQQAGVWGRYFVQVSHIAAFGFAVVTAVLVFWATGFSRRIRALRVQRDRLRQRIADVRGRAGLIDGCDDVPLPELVDGLEQLGNADIARQLTSFTEGPGLPFVSQSALSAEQDRLLDILSACMNSVGDLRESIAVEIGRHQRIVEESGARCAKLDAIRDDLRQRQQEGDRLRSEIDDLAVQRLSHEEYIATLELARQLVRETCRNIYSRFNQVLSKYTGLVMPRLTGGRYQQMRISDDLDVRVFSQDKNDFGALEEFSSGTQRQMLLAVRLAMSKALIEAAGQGRQFIILDEPFAFFDRERVRATLEALPEADKNLDQIWIISQEFDDIRPFSLHIECSRDSDELVVGQSG